MKVERNVARHEPRDGAIAVLSGQPLLANTGIPLNLDWAREVRVNTSAVERRAQSQVARRTVKKRMAGGVATPRNHLHGPDHSLRR